jgi:hypothetical protein
MAIRRAPRKYDREEMVAYIHGIDPNGDVAHIVVHKKGDSVRFSGGLGEHKLASSKSAGLPNWVQEAETVWGLEEAMGIARGGMTAPETREKLESMNVSAARKKKELEKSANELQT